MKPCLLVPVFDHGATVDAVLGELEAFQLPCVVVDDGSGPETREVLQKLRDAHPWVHLERLPVNQGKGAALRHGFKICWNQGFTHALQIDADGQHATSDVPRLLEAAQEHPDALILGEPIFEDAPALRLFGRQFSRVLVWVETLGFEIRDPLCGLRCMPLERTLQVLAADPGGDRMEFEPEIAVRVLWSGAPVVSVPTRVQYFEAGVSHFDALWDTLRIARAHGRLLAGMIPRSPKLLRRTLRRWV